MGKAIKRPRILYLSGEDVNRLMLDAINQAHDNRYPFTLIVRGVNWIGFIPNYTKELQHDNQ